MLEFNEVSVLDKNAEALGVPTSELMENAGSAVADLIANKLIGSEKVKKPQPETIFFCGPGNNGGDGFVAARYLRNAGTSKIILTVTPDNIRTALAKSNLDKIKDELTIIEVPTKEEVKKLLKNADIVVDAMLGVGITGKLREPYSSFIEQIQSSDSIKVSVDAPTGLGTDKSLKPDYTITFHDWKVGMNKDNSGEIIVAPIGIPKDAERYIGPGELTVYYPKPDLQSHKGQNGRLLIVGGGPYTGAPALAASAALRTGVDLVHIATPSASASVIAGYSPNFIVHPLKGSSVSHLVPEDIDRVMELSKMCDACVLGLGVGRDSATFTFISDLLSQINIPVVLDADGLSAVGYGGNNTLVQPKKGWVVTPHFTEFQRLLKVVFGDELNESSELEDKCRKLARALHTVVVLKSKVDIVTDGENLKLNRTGNPGMTVGGTGDVLSGIIGALISKRVSLYNSGRIGTYMNGYAGDLVWVEKGAGLTSTDIIEAIPKVLTKFIKF